MKTSAHRINRIISTLILVFLIPGFLVVISGVATGNYVFFQWGLLVIAVGLILTAINHLLAAFYPKGETPLQIKTWRGVPIIIHRWEQFTTTPISLLSVAAFLALISLHEQLGLSNYQTSLISSVILLLLTYAVLIPVVVKGRMVLRYAAINGWTARVLAIISLVVLTFITVAYWGVQL